MSQAGREAIVGQRLRDAASDLPAAQTALDAQPSELVPGSMPTTFQLTGDQGLGQLERAQRTANPEPFQERAGEQNAARVGALGDLSPENANPNSVRGLLQQHMQTIDATGDAAVQAAQQAAQRRFAAAGGQMTSQDYGSAMRDQLEAAKAATKQQESGLWRAIDPDGTLAINGTPVKAAAQQIASVIPATAAPMAGDEAGVFQATNLLGTASPFSQYAALRSRLLDAIRTEAATNGQSQPWRRMQMLRGAMDATMENTADGVAQQQEQAVASGAMSPEQTMTARLAQDAKASYVNQNAVPRAISQLAAGGSGGFYPGSSAARGPAGASGATGEVFPSAGGFGMSPGNPGLQGEAQPVTPFDAAAAARYRAAADATKARAQTFNNPQVGPALQERGGMYRLGDSQIPQRFISSPEGAQAFIKAGGDPTTLHDALVADLRATATNPDGTLNPTRFASWQLRRNGVLRSSPQLQRTLGNAATAQEAVDTVSATTRQESLQFQKSAARHFLNAEPAQAVQSVFASKNPVADMSELSRLVSADPDAKAGLQRAVADFISQRFIGNTEVGTSGTNALKSDAFQTFVKRNAGALSQVFSPDQMASMNAIAADLARSNRSIVGSKIPGQSNTAQDIAAMSKASLLRRYMGQGAVTAAGAIGGYLVGDVRGALEGAGSAAFIKRALDGLRATGITKTDELTTEALLHPELAKTLMMVASPGNRPFIAQRLGSQLDTLGAVAGVTSQASTPARTPAPAPTLTGASARHPGLARAFRAYMDANHLGAGP